MAPGERRVIDVPGKRRKFEILPERFSRQCNSEKREDGMHGEDQRYEERAPFHDQSAGIAEYMCFTHVIDVKRHNSL